MSQVQWKLRLACPTLLVNFGRSSLPSSKNGSLTKLDADFLCCLTGWDIVLRRTVLACLLAFTMQPQCLFSQTVATRPDLVDGIGKTNNNVQPVIGQRGLVPKAEHPFASLTVIVGNDQRRDGNLSRYVSSACYENTFYQSFFLRADGTMYCSRRYPLEVRIASPESVVESIELGGTMKDNCFLDLQVDGDVDFNTVAKIIQSLQGVEKRFERFQLVYGYVTYQRFPKSLNVLRKKYPDIPSFRDEWGGKVSYIVTNKGTACRFTSAGKDGKFDTDDDLTERVEENWSDQVSRQLQEDY